ncbi:MAG: hypothetical protein WC069_00685 [Candidatus Shapirobacteria bacterium]
MKIDEIYQRFSVPQNLAEHMFRVFGVVSVVGANWTGESLDWNLLKKLALLHDLGNIVKFNLTGDELQLKETQKMMIDKYGADDHEATGKMVKELGFDDESVDTIQSKSFGNSVAISESSNYLLKILYYADMRVLPNGIGTLDDRLSDVRNRMPKYTSRPDFEDLIGASRDIETQIQKSVSISLPSVNNETIVPFISEASTYDIN